jgi:hypothetical protein
VSDSQAFIRNVGFAARHQKNRTGDPEPKLKTQPKAGVETGRIPRIARLMALAIKFDRLLRTGVVTDQAELARVGHVTRARITQVMNLSFLAPDIQEQILFLPRVTSGRDPLHERDLRPIAAMIDWREQRERWEHFCERRRVSLHSTSG